MRTPTRTMAWLIALASLVASGCGGPFDATVAGTITLDGAPVPRGTVTFAPQSPGPSAFGQIQPDGTYVLRTGREEGLPSGQYTATVIATEAPAQAQSAKGGPPPMGKPITPAWYQSSATSGLSYTVAPGDQDIKIELTSKPPAGWKPPGRR